MEYFEIIDKTNQRFNNEEYISYLKKGEKISKSNSDSITIRLSGRSPTSAQNYTDDHPVEWEIENENDSERIYFSITLSEVVQCGQDLRISNSTEPKYVYTCHLWFSSSPVLFWCFLAFLGLFYLILPPLLSTLYIRNIQGKTRSCFVFSERRGHYLDGEELKEQINKRKWRTFLLWTCSFLSLAVLSGIVYTFRRSFNNLLDISSHHAIWKIQLLRLYLI